MKDFFKNIFNSALFKITSLNSVSMLIKIFSGLISFKISSLFLGAAGIAIIENFRNFISLSETIAGLGFQSGIVKYVSSNEEHLQNRNQILSTSFFSLLFASIFVGLLIVGFSSFLNQYFFSDSFFSSYVFILVGFSIPFIIMNLYFSTVLNALSKFKLIIYCNIFGYLINVVLIYYLIEFWQIKGAIYAIVLTPVALSVLSFYYFAKIVGLKKVISLKRFDWSIVKNLSSFSLMTLIGGILTPIIYLQIRNVITINYDITIAGYWTSMTRIATFYMMFVTSICSLYFYPRLSKANDKTNQKTIIKEYLLRLMPVVIVGFLMVYFLRIYIIKVVLSEDFLEISPLFFWQIFGDLLKSIAMIFGYALLANKMTKSFIILEILSLGSFFILSKFLIKYGVNWIVISYFYSNAIYLICILITYFKTNNELRIN